LWTLGLGLVLGLVHCMLWCTTSVDHIYLAARSGRRDVIT